MNVIKIEGENLFYFLSKLKNFDEISRKNVAYDNIKSQGFKIPPEVGSPSACLGLTKVFYMLMNGTPVLDLLFKNLLKFSL